MPCRVVPYLDLVESRIPNDPTIRRELVSRWAGRVLQDHAPIALRQLGYDGEADKLQVIAVESLDRGHIDELFDALDTARWRAGEVTPSELQHELAIVVFECVRNAVQAVAHETGLIRTVLARWVEGVGPTDEIQQSDHDLALRARWRAMNAGIASRTIAHIRGGERGYVAEVARQYSELYPDQRASEYEGGWNGFALGKRYRVYSTFTDLDGVRHPWGESWRFDGCAFDPATSEVRFHVSAGVQLDSNGRPGPDIAVPPFRVAISVGDSAGRAHDLIRAVITPDV
ncbi:MAG: hypothetical protein AB7O24_23780 [Kofleriaceae bacterium]